MQVYFPVCIKGLNRAVAAIKTAVNISISVSKKTKEVGSIVFQSSKSTGTMLIVSSKDKIQKAGKLIQQLVGRKNV
jgi:hypothetical protein